MSNTQYRNLDMLDFIIFVFKNVPLISLIFYLNSWLKYRKVGVCESGGIRKHVSQSTLKMECKLNRENEYEHTETVNFKDIILTSPKKPLSIFGAS